MSNNSVLINITVFVSNIYALNWRAKIYLLVHTFAIIGAIASQSSLLLQNLQIPMLIGVGLIYGTADWFALQEEAEDIDGNGESVSLDVTEAPLFFAFIILGEQGWIIIAIATIVVWTLSKSPWYNTLITLGNRTLLYFLLLSLFTFLFPNRLLAEGIIGIVAITLLTIVCAAFSVLSLAVHVSFSSRQSLWTTLRQGYGPTAWVSLIPITIGAISSRIWTSDAWIAVLMLVPLIVAHQAMQSVGRLVTESRRNLQLSLDLKQLSENLELQVQERTASLQRVEQNREREVTDAVHDLGHELRTIEAALLKTDTTSEHSTLLFQSAQNVLTDMLLASQLRGNALQLNPDATDMIALVANVIHQLRPMFQQAECILSLDLPDDVLFAWCDGPRINRVIKNILHNALIYTLDYRTRAHIAITLTASDSMVLCTVVDNGPGMTQEQIAKLGAQFVRLQSGAERPDGAGIGLSFCARLLALSDGNLNIASDGLGCGTTVTIALPQVIEDNTLLNERVDDETHDEVTGLARFSA